MAETSPNAVEHSVDYSLRRTRESHNPIRIRELGLVDFQEAWALQRDFAEKRFLGGEDTVLLLQHPFVYTAGKRTADTDLPGDGSSVIYVDRGGKITWHGPGQIVGYPIIKLSQPLDVIHYVRILESVLMRVCAHFGVPTIRIEGKSGVWISDKEGGFARKIASIGVRVQRGVTMHGFSLNCNPDLVAYAPIVACGIADARATSLCAETHLPLTVESVMPVVIEELLRTL